LWEIDLRLGPGMAPGWMTYPGGVPHVLPPGGAPTRLELDPCAAEVVPCGQGLGFRVHHHQGKFSEFCRGPEAGSYLGLIDICITQLSRQRL